MKKIVIVEDAELIAQLLERRLRAEGYYIFVAKDGEEGLETIQREKPDLVLLDIVLPGMNGFQIIEQLKKDRLLRDMRIIIISNSGQSEEIEYAKEIGVSDWLVKTEFDLQEVIEKVRKCIGPGDEQRVKQT
jgi:DNA-binding response OmpR family regulator